MPLRVVRAVDCSWYQVGRFPIEDMPDTLLRNGRRVLREARELVHERQPGVEVTTLDAEGVEAAVRHCRARSTSLVSGLSAMGSSSVTITVPPTWAR